MQHRLEHYANLILTLQWRIKDEYVLLYAQVSSALILGHEFCYITIPGHNSSSIIHPPEQSLI